MSEVTLLLERWRQGDQTAMDILLTTVYEELRGLARSRMRLETDNHTLQPTALIHELFFRC